MVMLSDGIKSLIHQYTYILNTKAIECNSNTRFDYIIGRKYVKIYDYDQRTGTPRSAHAFVDFDGNVYKVARWDSPTKGIRYNLNTDMQKLSKVADIYTSYLYAR
jgi:hypothetical protein